jgi:LacI family transcriptional regulator
MTNPACTIGASLPVPSPVATISGIDAPPSSVTVLDVAREAGVSPSTVSRILNGTARVTSDKRSAVEEAIRKLDFRPNLFARSLKTGTTMTIGILTQDVESPFYGRAMKGIEAGLAGTGYAPIMVSGHWNAAEESERVRLLMARRIDGLVILTGHLDDRQIAEFARHQPIVVTGRQLDAPQVRAFTLDQEAGGHLATRHLLNLGHRRIAHIAGPSDHTDATDRRAGYERALREAGIDSGAGAGGAGRLHGKRRPAGDEPAARQRADLHRGVRGQRPDGLRRAHGAVSARRARARRRVHPGSRRPARPPRMPPPPMTTVRQPIYEIGLAAAHALLTMLGHPMPAVEVPPLELVVRETTRRV